MKRRGFFQVIGVAIAGVPLLDAFGPWETHVIDTSGLRGWVAFRRLKTLIEKQRLADPESVFTTDGQSMFEVYSSTGLLTSSIMYKTRQRIHHRQDPSTLERSRLKPP